MVLLSMEAIEGDMGTGVQIYLKTVSWYFILHLIRKQNRGPLTESMIKLSYRTLRSEA